MLHRPSRPAWGLAAVSYCPCDERVDIALPVRPGEHACCRFARPEDRERLTIAFVRAGLGRNQKVIYLYQCEDPVAFLQRLLQATRAPRRRSAPGSSSCGRRGGRTSPTERSTTPG